MEIDGRRAWENRNQRRERERIPRLENIISSLRAGTLFPEGRPFTISTFFLVFFSYHVLQMYGSMHIITQRGFTSSTDQKKYDLAFRLLDFKSSLEERQLLIDKRRQ